jgi:hypothetical protein
MADPKAVQFLEGIYSRVDKQVRDIVTSMLPGITFAAQDDGSVVANDHRIINFQGPGVAVTDDSAFRRVNVYVPGAPVASSTTSIVSTTGYERVFDAGLNGVSAPANWYTTAFVDTGAGWSDSVTYDSTLHFTTAQLVAKIGGAQLANTTWLYRRHFTLTVAPSATVTLEVFGQDVIEEVYVNGTLVYTGSTAGTISSLTLPPSRLMAGANVLAIRLKGTASSGDAYSDAVMADSPWAYYKTTESTPTTAAADASGNAHTGTLGAATSPPYPWPRPGPFTGWGAIGETTFPATSVYVATPGWTSSYRNMTLEGWFNLARHDIGSESVMAQNLGSAMWLRWGQAGAGCGLNALSMQIGGTWGTCVSTGIWAAEGAVWHYIAVSIDGSGAASLYVDGALVDTRGTVTASVGSGNPIRFGEDMVTSWLGGISRCAVYTSALSSTRIAAHYAAAGPLGSGAMQSAYRLDAGLNSAGTDAQYIPYAIADAKGDLIAGTGTDTAGRLAVGTNGYVLTADSSTATGLKWAAGGGMSNPMTTQDDIIVSGSSGTPGRLAKGSDSQVLTIDPTSHHVSWATPAGGGGGAAVVLIQEINVVGSLQTTISFTAIPATYRHLEIWWLIKEGGQSATQQLQLRFNNDSANNYRYVAWDSGGTFGSSAIAQIQIANVPGSPAGTASSGVVRIPYYINTTYLKSCTCQSWDAGNLRSATYAGQWASTAVINRIDLLVGAGQFDLGSQVSLYGVT